MDQPEGGEYQNGSTGDDPGFYLGRPSSSTNYEYYGFHYFSPYYGYSFMDELRPVQENFMWRNLTFNNVDVTNGYFNTGAFWDYTVPKRTITGPKYLYTGLGLRIAAIGVQFD